MTTLFGSRYRFYITIVFLAFFSVFSAFIIFTTLPQNLPFFPDINNRPMFMVALYSNRVNFSEPFLFYINFSEHLSFNKINISKILHFNNSGINGSGIHETRSFRMNNTNYLVLGTYFPGEILILSGENQLDFEKLKTEYVEEIDSRVRAVDVGDVDDDGKKEIVVGTRPHGVLKIFELVNGKWEGYELDTLNETIHDLLIEDSDEDGVNEILITTSVTSEILQTMEINRIPPPKILKYEYDKSQNRWKKEVVKEFTEIFSTEKFSNEQYPIADPYKHARYIFVGDFDGDDSVELVVNVMPHTTNLMMFEWDGNGYSQVSIEQNINLNKDVIIADDIDYDNKKEIITATEYNDALLIYDFEEGEWKRTVIRKEDNEKIILLMVLNSTKGGHKNILYMTSSNSTTKIHILEYDPQKDIWESNQTDELNFTITHSWGIFPAF